jgi:TolB-like protein/Tfp pilus assembly protein PilF
MIGRTVGPYRILERLGAGGMGEVYRARDDRLQRDVALKVFAAGQAVDDAARARLLREARAASALNHPNICTIHDVGESDGQAFIAMEYVEGQPLAARIPPGGLPVESVLRYGTQVADAVAHAHERGVVHRDLKCANVVVTPEGRAKVLDFGLAKRMQEAGLEEATRSQASLTEPGAVAGTLAYMAPEQLRGQPADARSDIWALGVMLQEMVTGQRPFQGNTGYELSSAILREPPAPLPATVLPGLRAVIHRCLAKEPGQRYQRAAEVRAALQTLEAEPSSRPAAVGVGPELGHPAAGVVRQVQEALELFGAWRRARKPEKEEPDWWSQQPRWAQFLFLGMGMVFILAIVFITQQANLEKRRLAANAPKIESLAVLPLENLSRDPEQEYFADGMTEALITDLSKISALRVISRTSVMRYKGAARPPMATIARELDVDAVVEGTVQRAGERVRITAQLIDARADRHLWAEIYERDLRDVLALQSEVARAIAAEIRVTVTPAEQALLTRTQSVDPKALEAYLKGRFYASQLACEKGIPYFDEAIRIHPTYALAYAELGICYADLQFFRRIPPEEAGPKAEKAARKALEIDGNLPRAHIALGYARGLSWDWETADKEFHHAIELNPGDAESHYFYHYLCGIVGRLDEYVAHIKQARQLDPLSQHYNTQLGGALLQAGRYEEAIEQLRLTLELFPENRLAHRYLGLAYLKRGKAEAGIAELEKASGLDESATLGYAYGVSGNRLQAKRILRRLEQKWNHGNTSSFDIAGVYAGLDERTQTFEWLETAYEKRDSGLIYLKIDPRFDRLRSDSRFQAILRRMGLPPS